MDHLQKKMGELAILDLEKTEVLDNFFASVFTRVMVYLLLLLLFRNTYIHICSLFNFPRRNKSWTTSEQAS